MSRPQLWMLHGPTASGKTALAIALAKAVQAPIVNCDARQLYREMSIGVARPSDEELRAAAHWGIASHSIHEPLTAMSYARWARPLIQDLLAQHGQVIVVGGSGLYARALLYASDALPAADPALRSELEATWQQDPHILKQKLRDLDPVYAAQADLQNSRRVIRALEIMEITGRPYSSQRTQESSAAIPYFDADLHESALWPDMEVLTPRIMTRTQAMFENGLRQEVESLRPFKDLTAMQTVGYREFYEQPNAQDSDLIQLIATHTRQYAKRQCTWIQKQPAVRRLPLGATPKDVLRL
ncbi:MAG TPA: tRNA (adenosine(37)-N6)-dimethylallyltransferase MiaA [Cryomorphaceae bacterium]|jgi:tRNA dimethylallyltransferase|nr:tRNA (adenosine(37)-N6)-dimethylallyltransferase MiaA [Cryomorphaceae bacterium]